MLDMIITDKEAIINEYVTTDITLEELSKIYSIELEDLHRLVQEFDKHHKIDIESQKVICKLYDRSNFSIKEIAFIVNCSDLTISKIAKKYGLKKRKEKIAEEYQKKVAAAVDYYIKNPKVSVKDIEKKFNVSGSTFCSQVPKHLKRTNPNRFYYSKGGTKPINLLLCDYYFNKIDIMDYDINVYTKALFYLVLFSRSVLLYNCNLIDIGDTVYIVKVKQYDPTREIDHTPEVCVCSCKEHAEEIYNSIIEIMDEEASYITVTVAEYSYSSRFYKLSEELLNFKNKV